MNSKLEQRKRSFSYNDLKKKRMQRQMKTNKKSQCRTIEPKQSSQKCKKKLNFKTVVRPEQTIKVHSQTRKNNSHSSCYFSKNKLGSRQEDQDSLVEIKEYAKQTIEYRKDEPLVMSERRIIQPVMQKLRYLNNPQKNQYSQNLDYLKNLKKKLNSHTLEQRKSYNQGLNLNPFNKIRDQVIQKSDDHMGKVQLKTKSSSKQLVKILLEKSKSKKRILRLEQIRDKIKSERSQSKSLEKSAEFTGIIALRDKLELNRCKIINFNNQSSRYTTKLSSLSARIENKQKPTLSKSKSKTRLRKFVPLTEQQQKHFLANRVSKESNNTIQQNSQQKSKQHIISSKKKLLSPKKQAFDQWESKKRQVIEKYKVQLIPIQISDGQEDTVKRKHCGQQLACQQKQTVRKKFVKQYAKDYQNKSKDRKILNGEQSKIDLLTIDISQIQQKQQQNQDRNRPNQSFLGKSILQMVNTMQRKICNNIQRQNTSNFLDLVGLQTHDLKRIFNNREKKRRHEIERLKRIFPEDFFKK